MAWADFHRLAFTLLPAVEWGWVSAGAGPCLVPTSAVSRAFRPGSEVAPVTINWDVEHDGVKFMEMHFWILKFNDMFFLIKTDHTSFYFRFPV